MTDAVITSIVGIIPTTTFVILTYLTSRRTERLAKEAKDATQVNRESINLNRESINKVHEKLKEVGTDINGKMAELLELTKKASHAEGIIEGVEKNKAEVIETEKVALEKIQLAKNVLRQDAKDKLEDTQELVNKIPLSNLKVTDATIEQKQPEDDKPEDDTK